MTKNNEEVEKKSEEELEGKETEEELEDEEGESDEEESDTDEESEEDEDSDSSKTTKELDLDAELEIERKAGEPDKEIAQKKFKERQENREQKGGEEDDDKKPLTRADLAELEAKIRKDADKERAFEYAKEMTGSEKEAELVVAKWGNRSFPKTLTLRQQIEEAYAITHKNKLIGERNEALRALRGKNGVSKNAALTHRDAPNSGREPKMSAQDASAIKAAGFVFNTKTARYERKLPNGRMLIRDKSGKVTLLKK